MENFASTLDYQAERRPDKVVITHGDRRVTNAALHSRVNALAQALLDLGVRRGDIVGVLLYNCTEFLELVYAANRIGAAFLPLNYRLAPAEWEYILANSGAKVLVTQAEFQEPVEEILPRVTSLQASVLIDSASDSWLNYDSLVLETSGAFVPVADVGPDDLQRLMYTSGTTSRPKGVCITHRNLIYKNLGLIVQFGWTDQDVSVVGGPLYHVGGMDMGGLTTLHVGGSLVLQTKFEAAGMVGLLEQHQATNVWLAPAMVNAVLQLPEEVAAADLGSLRLIMSGGEKMPEARLKQVLDLFPGVWFADAYGLTETVSSDTFMPVERMRDKLGSVGKPIPHVRVRVADDSGEDVPPDVVGEVVIRGPKVFSGYWRDEEATQKAFQNGWFRTGDMGRIDADGFLYIEDRKKDMIVSGGENIATPEIERVLYEHPDIIEAAVIGHPDERWGEVPHAFVVVRQGAELTVENVQEFCRARLAKFKVPRYVNVIGELPRTPSGKVLKRNLREEGSRGLNDADEPSPA